MRPLHVLFFLLPFLVFYEIGSLVSLSSGTADAAQDVVARRAVITFFESFGLSNVHLPAISIVAVLMVWHLIRRDTWQINLRTIGTMWIESVVWMVPLLVLSMLFASTPQEPQSPALASASLHNATWHAKLTISIGAGLYEDMLFRLCGIAAIHFVVADLMRVPNRTAQAIAIVGSAALFAALHNVVAPGGGIAWGPLGFYLSAGIYLAAVYLGRGFGIVVGAHICYDIVALIILSPPPIPQ